MLNQLKQRLQQTSNSLKVTMQGGQAVKSTLSAEEIAFYLEQMLNDENTINIDEQDLNILNKMADIQIRVLDCEEEQLDVALPLLFGDITKADCIVSYISATTEFSLEEYHLIMQEMEKSANEEATLICGNGFGADTLQLFMLFGFDYTDEKLVQLFTEELKQNPQISISALQRKYSLGFPRAVRNLELAKQNL